MQDAIGHSKIRDITRTRDDRTAQAIETAVSSINHAEALGRDRLRRTRRTSAPVMQARPGD